MDDEQPPSRGRHVASKITPLLVATVFLVPFVAWAQSAGAPAEGVSATQIAVLVMLLLLSGMLSGSETALTALGEWKIRQIREEGGDPSGVYALLEKQPTRFITTLLIGNNLVNIAATALVTQISIQLSRQFGFGESLAVGYATGVMTLLILIFGEITPKSIAVHNAVGFSRLVIRPVYALSVVLYPLGQAFTFLSGLLLRAFNLEPVSSPLITENELRLMLRSAEESGVIAEQEEKMIKGIIDLEETIVREVMTPRVDVVGVDADATLHEMLGIVTESGFSRLPVYGESIDDVQGTVHARDLLPYLGQPQLLESTRVQDIVKAAQYVPETLSVLNLMRDMRQEKMHIAVVVDEFGGTSGVITLEDIIEEITGEIYDESDDEDEEEIVELGNGVFLIKGSVHLEDVAERFGVVFEEEGEYDTLAGFLIARHGSIPQVHEELHYEGFRFVVTEGDARRVSYVQAERLPEGAAFQTPTPSGQDDPSDSPS